MGIIQVLDDHMINLIAAGEVVSRPVNIVKECIENSIDAGADTIEISVRSGGIDEIQISDNGSGMEYDDCRTAFERHATSKIHEAEDLQNLHTMGFRGEALSSILSVASVELYSSTEKEGTFLKGEYGKITEHERMACPQGTRLVIRHLFSRIPVRLKYLKRPSYEFSLISDCVSKMALSHPDIRFVLRHDGRPVFQSRGNGDRRQILYQLFGALAARESVSFEDRNADYQIEGLAVMPSNSRANQYSIYLSVNGRSIQSSFLVRKIRKGYEEYMPPGRFPILWMNIKADPQLIDVNIHPNKLQVRMRKEEELGELIERAIRNALQEGYRPADEVKPVSTVIEEGSPSSRTNRASSSVSADTRLFSAGKDLPAGRKASSGSSFPKEMNIPSGESGSLYEVRKPVQEKAIPAPEKLAFPAAGRDNSPEIPSGSPEDLLQDRILSRTTIEPENLASEMDAGPEGKPAQMQFPDFPRENPRGRQLLEALRVIGQLKASYILCEGPQGLIIIDQHAAQERYHFEQIVERMRKQEPVLQDLTVPLSFHADPWMLQNLEEINSFCRPYGLHFEAGDDALVLRSLPTWIHMVERDAFLQDLLDIFRESREIDMEKMYRHVLATVACHQSIRFNHFLRQDEMEQVIEDLKKCRQPFHCPHGRPTLIEFDTKRLAREFYRG